MNEKDESVPEIIADLHKNVSQGTYEQVIQETNVKTFIDNYHKYLNELKTEGSTMTTFWLSYIDLIKAILDIIFATRSGQWEPFLESIRDAAAWAFAYDRYNYSRYLPVFLSDMLNLETSHPSVYNAFIEGQFSVELSKNNPFGRNEADKTIENTINKDTKTPGGLTGM